MARSFRQIRLPDQALRTGLLNIDVGEAPQEAPVAVMAEAPEEIEHRLGVVFQRFVDNLDYVAVVVLELPSGRRVSLIRHIRSPSPGTEIHVALKDIDNPQVLREILADLGLTRADLSWVRQPLE